MNRTTNIGLVCSNMWFEVHMRVTFYINFVLSSTKYAHVRIHTRKHLCTRLCTCRCLCLCTCLHMRPNTCLSHMVHNPGLVDAVGIPTAGARILFFWSMPVAKRRVTTAGGEGRPLVEGNKTQCDASLGTLQISAARPRRFAVGMLRDACEKISALGRVPDRADRHGRRGRHAG